MTGVGAIPGTIGAAARFLPAGDTGLVVEFGDAIDPELSARVTTALAAIEAARPVGIREMLPTYRSLLVQYDPLVTSQSALRAAIAALPLPESQDKGFRRIWRIPVLYGGEAGPDLEAVASATGLTPDEVVARHAATVYRVYMLGFVPGFAYLGDVEPALRVPRHKTPRVRVPAGTVAMALQMTAVYPRMTPGGWQLLGHTPVRFFDPTQDPPSLLVAGDGVRFVAVDADRYAVLSRAADAGEAIAEAEADA